MTIDEIQKQIKDVVDFTCEYWWPAYERAKADKSNTPTAPAIILDIIETRGRYVKMLQDKLLETTPQSRSSLT